MSTPSGRGRVCFYSEYAYPLIARQRIDFAGGAEALIVRQARALAARGWDVSLVTCDFGQPAREVIDGIEVLRTFRPHGGVPVVRFLPRLLKAASTLAHADADVYYVCGSGVPAGLASEVAHLRGAAFVLAMMTDYDVIPDPPPGSGATHRGWFRRALRSADRVLAQTVYQRDRLREHFGVESGLLPNIIEIPPLSVDAGQDGPVLWLATYKASKRPEWFVELARALPHRRFVMAGILPPPPLTRECWDRTVEAARELPNLEVNGFLPEPELDALRRQAALVVHTSPVEGFSNVLLEAWAAGLPTVACVDPDGLIASERMGAFVSDPAGLAAAVAALMDDPAERRAAGARARAYAERRHAPAAVLAVLEGVLEPLVAARRRRAR
jgi:glycosyltransferase involved in cell wall biosynthesis